MVAELLEELFIQILSQTLAGAQVHAEQLLYLRDLRPAITSLHQFLLNAYIHWLLTHTFTEWDNAIVIFLQDSTDHVGYQLKAEALGSLRRKHPGMAELIPYFDRVHAMVVAVAELLPAIIVLIELFEIRDLWLLVVDGKGIQMLPNFC